jgi:hypothetical protein
MEIDKVTKGERCGLPLSAIGAGEGFCHSIAAPADGIYLRMKVGEGIGGGIFILATQLEAAGYVPAIAGEVRISRLLELFGRSELVEIASRLGVKASGTKQALFRRILHKV